MGSVVVVEQIHDRDQRVHWHAQHFVCPSLQKGARARARSGEKRPLFLKHERKKRLCGGTRKCLQRTFRGSEGRRWGRRRRARAPRTSTSLGFFSTRGYFLRTP